MKKDTKRTLIVFGLGLLLAASGFLYLWKGSLTTAPILIIGGYLVMIISLIPFKSEEK
ncbi:hypothetical protein KAT51_06855 [bacterium]|nr:hypothetical protein [bacterium]